MYLNLKIDVDNQKEIFNFHLEEWKLKKIKRLFFYKFECSVICFQ